MSAVLAILRRPIERGRCGTNRARRENSHPWKVEKLRSDPVPTWVPPAWSRLVR